MRKNPPSGNKTIYFRLFFTNAFCKWLLKATNEASRFSFPWNNYISHEINNIQKCVIWWKISFFVGNGNGLDLFNSHFRLWKMKSILENFCEIDFTKYIYKYYILTARIKKSSCIHETQPKFEYLNMRSIIHITRSAKRDLAVNSVMHKGTSAVDWWFGMNKILSSDTCSKGTRSPDSTTLYPAGK